MPLNNPKFISTLASSITGTSVTNDDDRLKDGSDTLNANLINTLNIASAGSFIASGGNITIGAGTTYSTYALTEIKYFRDGKYKTLSAVSAQEPTWAKNASNDWFGLIVIAANDAIAFRGSTTLGATIVDGALPIEGDIPIAAVQISKTLANNATNRKIQFLGMNKLNSEFTAVDSGNVRLTINKGGTLTHRPSSTDYTITLPSATGTLALTGESVNYSQLTGTQPDINADKITSGVIPDARIASASTWNAKQDALTFGKLNTNTLKLEETVATNDILQAGNNQVKGLTYAQLKTALALVKGDVDLGNVDNTSDSAKPVSSDTQTALDLKAPAANPTFTGTVSGITKSDVGLANVENVNVATIRGGVTKSNVGLSNVENITTAAIREGVTAANVGLGNVTNVSQSTIQSATLTAATKADVGLGNVDNTSDATKQTAILSAATKSDVGLGNVDNTSDSTIQAAILSAATATDVGLGNVLNEVQTTVFKQNDAPNARVAGDLWVDTNDGNKLYRATGTGTGNWEEVTVAKTALGLVKADVGLSNVDNDSTATIRAGTTAANVGLGNVTNEAKATMFANPTFTGTIQLPGISDLKSTVDAKANTSAIRTDAEINALANTRVESILNVTGAASGLQTLADISDALSDDSDYAATIVTQMATKTKVFKQDDIPTSTAVGDLWVDTNDNNKMYHAASVGADEVQAGEWVEITINKTTIGLSNVDNDSTATIRSGVTKTDVGLGNVDNDSTATIRSGVTKANVGLGNVDNKSASTLQSEILTAVSKSDVGLGNVDNTSDASKQTAILSAVSASDVGLGNVLNVAQVKTFVQDDAPTATAIGDIWIDSNDDNKMYRASATGNASWVAVSIGKGALGLVKADVGLSNVDNTSDASIQTAILSAATASDVGLGNVENKSASTIIGEIVASDIPDLDAGKITTGTLSTTRGGTGLTAITSLLNSNTTKSNVGLGNVDNESKATMFTAPTFTGTITVPDGASGTQNLVSVVNANTSKTGISSVQATAIIANTTKPKIFYGTTPPTSVTVGDLWHSTDNDNLVYRANAVGVNTVVTTGNGWYVHLTPTNKLKSAVSINGVQFDGSANVTVAAAAGTLTGTALPSGVTSSSLTTVGTIATGTWNADAIAKGKVSTTGTWADDDIAESSVTQHEAAISIGNSQLSGATNLGKAILGATNLGNSETKFLKIATDTNGNHAITARTDTQIRGDIGAGTSNLAIGPNAGDALAGNTSIPVDLTADGAGVVHANNYTDTQYSVMNSGNGYAAGLVKGGSGSHGNKFLRQDGEWINPPSESGGITSVAADSTPQLGGDLDANGNKIKAIGNADLIFEKAQGSFLFKDTDSANASVTIGPSSMKFDFQTDGGSGDAVLQYVDSGGVARNFVTASSNTVAIENRAANGEVHIYGNTSTAGSSGRTLVAAFADTAITTQKPIVVNAQGGGISFADSNESHFVAIAPHATTTQNYTIKLPAAQGGANTILKNDGSGNLSWAADNDTQYANLAALDSAANTKLSNIATNANNYAHPSYSTDNIDTANAEVIDTIVTNSQGHVTAMSKRTMTLANLGYTGATDANNYSHPTTAGNKHIPTGGASGQFLKYSSSGTAIWATPSYTTELAYTAITGKPSTFAPTIGNTSTTAKAGDTTTITVNQANAITTNSSKVSNVSTNLGVSTTSTTINVTSSDGNDATLPIATDSAGGVMSAAMFSKLSGIEASADVTDTANVKNALGAAMPSNTLGIGDANSTITVNGNLVVKGTTSYSDETIQIVEDNTLAFRAGDANTHEIKLTANDATTDRTITLPNADGTVAISASAGVALDNVGNLTANLSATHIPSLAASKITSGTFNTGRIPSLAASKITSGTFATARIADDAITGDKIASNSIVASNMKFSNVSVGSDQDNMVVTYDHASTGFTLVSGAAGGENNQSITTGTGIGGANSGSTGNITLAIDSTVATLTGNQTLQNKTIAISQITELSNLTASEGAQLENIQGATISAAQWGYVGGLTANKVIDWTGSNAGVINASNYDNDNTQNVFTSSFVDSTNDTILRLTKSGASSGTQDIKFVAGSNVTLTPDGANLTIASSDTNTTYSVGDGGLTQNNFTNTLKSKLDNIASSANNYSLPTANGSTLGGIKVGTNLSIDGSGVLSSTDTNTNRLTTFTIRDADDTDVIIANNRFIQFAEGNGLDINFTGTDNGNTGDPFELTFKIADDGVSADQLNVSGNGTSGYVLTSDGDGTFSWSAKTTNTNTTYSAGTGLTLSSTTFSHTAHTGEVTGSTALTIANNVVDEANLKISNTGSNGQFLSKQSGNTGGLTWATPTDTNTFRTITAGGNTLGSSETLAFTAGSNVTITESDGAVTIAASASGGGIGGSIADNQVAVGSSTSDEIEGSASYTATLGGSGSTNVLKFGHSDGTTGYTRLRLNGTNAYLEFRDNSDNRKAAIGFQSSLGLRFFAKAGGLGATEALRITPDDEWMLNGSNVGTAGQVLTSGGSGAAVSWANAAGGIASLAADTTPQLGGDLDVNGKTIVSVSNKDILIQPDGTGNVGIGVANPGYSLHVVDDSALIIAEDGSSGIQAGLKSGDAAGNVGTFTNSAFNILTNDTARIGIASGGAITFNSEYTFPTSDGSNGQVLQTNGSGTLSFASAGGTDTYVIVGEEGDLYSGTGSTGNANGYQFSFGNGAQNSSKSNSGTDFGINVGVACKLVRLDITYGNSGNVSSGTTTFVVVKNGTNQSGNLSTSHSSGVHDTHHTSLDYDFAAGDRFNLRTTTSSRQVGPFRMTATFQVA